MDLLPDNILLDIFNFLPIPCLIQAAYSCRNWYRVAMDNLLWKNLLHRHWRIPRSVPMMPGKRSWYEECRRLKDLTPTVECQVIQEHKDQVLHVSFSHNGKYFATSSKDGFIKVWSSTHPVVLRYQHDMKPEFNWKYTQYSVFNESDTLLLVSGVHFGNLSTSGEIAVFSIVDNFELQCRVINKPYDVFGTWYNDTHLVSGNLHWTGHLNSCSALWLNKATQAIESEHESVVMQWLKFNNSNASSIRTVMIANCPPDDGVTEDSCQSRTSSDKTCTSVNETSASHPDASDRENTATYRQSSRNNCEAPKQTKVNMVMSDDSVRLNGTIEYDPEYWNAESRSRISERKRRKFETSTADFPCACCDASEVVEGNNEVSVAAGNSSEHNLDHCISRIDNDVLCDDTDVNMSRQSPPVDRFEQCNSESVCDNVCLSGSSAGSDTTSSKCSILDSSVCDKLLIFTRGTLTYTPHQIGIKRIKPLESVRAETSSLSNGPVRFLLPSVEENQHGMNRPHDDVDEVIDMDGHVIGMSLSPDHKYLYVNSRPWPNNYHIENPLQPPPIAQEIDIHVIDLRRMKEVGTMLRSHKAYTANDECFFIFLDVCHEYVASGAEDKHGYIWDRHYGVCLNKFAHSDVVNSVAFNPQDSQMLVTVSDDHHIKIWRSKNQCRHLDIKVV
ncbi:F-box/WD repeat-containing protein 5-like [Gigantopelta aegis]|uniref:F-box/WD repeat-containing protein 5-like n=1 Tax=Gigantopelta aegis TaxID=1735272 RepID=UPI001B88D91B|nr:F-box/WD repeat-containing protein 5-like [Gigantopelta aegis]XP_041369354.1 F-box/WD repeat-containing protein 5-like [Gigantopelta aegis]